jgi:hypothetical protein
VLEATNKTVGDLMKDLDATIVTSCITSCARMRKVLSEKMRSYLTAPFSCKNVPLYNMVNPLIV